MDKAATCMLSLHEREAFIGKSVDGMQCIAQDRPSSCAPDAPSHCWFVHFCDEHAPLPREEEQVDKKSPVQLQGICNAACHQQTNLQSQSRAE